MNPGARGAPRIDMDMRFGEGWDQNISVSPAARKYTPNEAGVKRDSLVGRISPRWSISRPERSGGRFFDCASLRSECTLAGDYSQVLQARVLADADGEH